MRELLIYLIVVNIIGLFSMYIDKRKAIKKKYRIPEKTLFGIAIIGGSLGSYIGMRIFRHKTRHWYFAYGIPLIYAIQIIVLYFVLESSL